MPAQEFDLVIIVQTHDDDSQLAEALFYPEVSRYGDDPEKLKKAIRKNAIRILETENLPRLYARTTPAEVETGELILRLEPSAKNLAWREPIDLKLDVLRWRHEENAHLAFIPALGIEVVSQKANDLITVEGPARVGGHDVSLLERHARAELLRRRVKANFIDLLLLERKRGLSVTRLPCVAEIRTPKQVAVDAGRRDEKKKSVLEETCLDLTKQKLAPAFEVEGDVARLAEAITGRAAGSVLLIGQPGVGKTSVVHELVRRRAQIGLSSTPFWATSGARLVAGMSGFGMWQERCAELWAEAERTNAVIHFGNLVELMDTGKSEHNAQGLASFFRQRFARTQALALLECTPEQLPVIEREDPALLRVLHQITVAEPSPEDSKKILQQAAENFPRDDGDGGKGRRRRRAQRVNTFAPTSITEDGLDTLDRLHRRYAGYSAYPGRPLRFLRGLLQDHLASLEAGSTLLSGAEVTAHFAKETGLPLFLLDEQVAFDEHQTAEWFGRAVIGQSAAVNLVVELLARVKAGLTRPRRPIASLLFAGPTGVGKTEMAKALARFFFGDESRLARFDMSEYANQQAVTRLVGGLTGGEGTLTARIRDQPFSVLLFDEFEKAHESFFDLLLQTLGDGRLTDGRGRAADFTNAIIVITSNLGAEGFRRANPGFRNYAGNVKDKAQSDDGQRARKHFVRAVRGFLRPEIFNRLDHIVPFLPLELTTVERIAERELEMIVGRDGLRMNGVSLHVESEAVALLARQGYDARYGARPLKRMIEREMLLPLAVELNERIPEQKAKRRQPLRARVGVGAGRTLRVQVEEHESSPVEAQTSFYQSEASFAARAERLSGLRRRVQRLGRSSIVAELQNTIWRLTAIESRIARAAQRAKLKARVAEARHAAQRPEEATALVGLSSYRQIADALKKLEEHAATAEDKALLALYGRDAGDRLPQASSLTEQQIGVELNALLRRLLDLRYAPPDRLVLAIYGENKRSLIELARAYYEAFTDAATSIKVRLAHYGVAPPNTKEGKLTAGVQPLKQNAKKNFADGNSSEKEEKNFIMFGREVVRMDVANPAEFLSSASGNPTAIVFNLTGPSVAAAYQAERGLHTFLEEKAAHHLFVHTSDADFDEYVPPSSLEQRGAITPLSHGERRRAYHRSAGYVEDGILEERRAWLPAKADPGWHLTPAIKYFAGAQLDRAAERLIDE